MAIAGRIARNQVKVKDILQAADFPGFLIAGAVVSDNPPDALLTQLDSG
jgi:hypothetical protein